jgi:hypothetical protein
VSTIGATRVKCGDTDGSTAKASGKPDCTRMAEPTGIVRDHAKTAE